MNTVRKFSIWYKVYSILLKQKNKKSPVSLPHVTSGFTIVELVTAIGVLAVLISVALVVVNPIEQFQKGADAKRKSDLSQIRKALEIYYQDYGRYPQMTPDSNRISTDGTNSGLIDWGASWKPYMDVVPIEKAASRNYAYWVDESSGGQAYALYASLDRGGKDPDSCNDDGSVCANAGTRGVACGGTCNYGVTSSNIAP